MYNCKSFLINFSFFFFLSYFKNNPRLKEEWKVEKEEIRVQTKITAENILLNPRGDVHLKLSSKVMYNCKSFLINFSFFFFLSYFKNNPRLKEEWETKNEKIRVQTKIIRRIIYGLFLFGSLKGTRTPDSAVRGRRLNRLTMRP